MAKKQTAGITTDVWHGVCGNGNKCHGGGSSFRGNLKIEEERRKTV